MIISVNYLSKHKVAAQEIRCPWNQLGSLLKFIQEYPDKRYNIILPESLTKEELNKLIEQVELVKTITGNYTIRCRKIYHLHSLLALGYNAYLSFPVSDWETYQNLRELKVSDIYIDGPLGFQMEALAKSKGDIKIRVSPTVSANNVLAAKREYNSFFIRPEDVENYDAIDILDFQEHDQEREDTLYSIYKRGTFNYNISDLIPGLPDINNLIFKPEFGICRSNCGQRCRIPGHVCHHCEHYFKIIEYVASLTGMNDTN